MAERLSNESDESGEERDYTEKEKEFKENKKQSFKKLKLIDGKYKKSAMTKLAEDVGKLEIDHKVKFGQEELDSPKKKREPNFKEKPKKSIIRNLRRKSLEKKLEKSEIKVVIDQRKASLNVDLLQRKQFLKESPERKSDSFLSQLRKISNKQPELIEFFKKKKDSFKLSFKESIDIFTILELIRGLKTICQNENEMVADYLVVLKDIKNFDVTMKSLLIEERNEIESLLLEVKDNLNKETIEIYAKYF